MKTNCVSAATRGVLSLSLGLLLACVCTARAADAPATAAAPATALTPAILKAEFIAPNPAVPSCHASTLTETPEGLAAAWFGGTDEGSPDVGIWLSRDTGSGWTVPEEVANGTDVARQQRFPCWNPVLFQRSNGQLLLFYKVGPSPSTWWGMVRLSNDFGQTWVKARKLPPGFVGPVRSKPYELATGTLLCGSSSEDRGWRVHMEWSDDPFGIWERTGPLNAAFTVAAIQPTVLRYPDGRFQILCRTKQARLYEAWSSNLGTSWTDMVRTPLPNPNSGVDGVVLRDGRALLVYNHTQQGRSPLNLALSTDGKAWMDAGLLEHEPGAEFSYPAIIQTRDSLVHVTYTWKRQRIKHVVLDPAKLQLKELPLN